MSQPERPPASADPARQVAADAVVILVFAIALIASRDFAPVARWFPTAVGLVGMAAGAGKLVVDLLAVRRANRPAVTGEPEPDAAAADLTAAPAADLTAAPLTAAGRRELLVWLGLIAVLLALIGLIGLVAAAAVWLPAVLWWKGKRSVPLAAGGAVGVVVVMMLMEAELHVRWPDALFDIYGMLT